MPELPEVEVCRRGIAPELEGREIVGVIARVPRLRQPIPPGLDECLRGCRIQAVRRRGKYLLLDCWRPEVSGTLIIHLGMSGHLRFVGSGAEVAKHDHFDLCLSGQSLRLSDPRRFGVVAWQPGPPEQCERHPLLAIQGIEPLAPEFTVDWLHAAISRRAAPIKPVLMDSHLIVGIGNIYAAESLFQAGISPLTPAKALPPARLARLVQSIRATLETAIAAGGSSIRDYVHSDGSSGWFQIQLGVYGRDGQTCRRCGDVVRLIRQAGRSTFYCPGCQD